MKKLRRPNWFQSWFDSPYYDLLYKNRNEEEASKFINRIVNELVMPPSAKVLDLACGKGRHAKHLATKGFQVTGVDLSARNIGLAKLFEERGHLRFHRHDMREALNYGQFDYIFNLFTSFGYFATEAEHLQSLQNVSHALQAEGTFVLDFFNSNMVKAHLPFEEIKEQSKIEFNIKKQAQNKRVVKGISFHHQLEKHYFEESVCLFDLQDFEHLFTQAGLKIVAKYGDYELGTYDALKSPRLILIARKGGL